MKSPRIFVIATLAAAAGIWPGFKNTATGRELSIAEGSVAAIAYSPTTGKYGLAYNCQNRKSAEKEALSDCGAEDAQIVTWVEKGFCALALGADKSCWGVGWSFGSGSSTDAARQRALDDCRKRTTRVHIEAHLSSDGQILWKRLIDPKGGSQIWISPDSFAAIAYSPATGKYGIAHDRLSRESAEKDALSNCGAEDARVVIWVNKGFCALALGHDKAQWGVGSSKTDSNEAKQAALADYKGKTSGAAHIEVSTSSDGQTLWERSKNVTIILKNGDVVLPSGERVSSIGEMMLPTGEKFLPSGEVILPTGEKIHPAEGAVLPSGVMILSEGEVLLPSGEKIRVGKSPPSSAAGEGENKNQNKDKK
jgi:hypothetical protein